MLKVVSGKLREESECWWLKGIEGMEEDEVGWVKKMELILENGISKGEEVNWEYIVCEWNGKVFLWKVKFLVENIFWVWRFRIK